MLDRVGREIATRLFLIDAEKPSDQRAQLLGLQVGVGFDPGLLLGLLQRMLELLAVDALDRLTEHLNEATPRIEGKALVFGQSGEALGRFFVQAQVQDGVHHPGHGELRARADADQQRILQVAEFLGRLALEDLQRRQDLLP